MTRGLAIGWDVGGWLGKKQAVAVIEVGDDETWRYVGRPAAFTLRGRERLNVLELVRTAWPEAPADALDRGDVVLAIDAPLSFPAAFVRLLERAPTSPPSSDREIDNELAYRACDRFIHAEHERKKPLSASFDKLGNNATVAMVLTRRWRESEGFRVLPWDAPRDPRREIIEAYPALMKSKGEVVDRVRALLDVRLPDAGRGLGEDELDAAICALVALAHLGIVDPQLPRLVGPAAGQGLDGWIYGPSRAWVTGG